MAFFRTQEKRRDRSLADGARQQRREQLQTQLQMQEAHKATSEGAGHIEPAGGVE
jgi:hypothetical protein